MNRAAVRYRSLASDSCGASELVATVLVISITIGAIALVLALGLPAVENAKREEQFRSMTAQFEVLDETIETMVREGEASRRPFSFAIAAGYVTAGVESDRWVITAQYTTAHHVEFEELMDGDNATRLAVNTTLHVDVTIDWYHGYDAGERYQADNITTGTLLETRNALVGVVELVATDHTNGTVVARTWVFDTSTLAYYLDSPGGRFSLYLENGAVLKDAREGRERVVDPPLVSEYVLDPGSASSYASALSYRALILGLNTSFSSGSQGDAGAETINYRLDLLESATAPSAVVTELTIDVSGDHERIWLAHLEAEHSFDLDGTRLTYQDTPVYFHFGYSVLDMTPR